MNMRNTISDSAFLVNESRSRRVDISKDIYAHVWTTDETHRLWKDFSEQVYPYDDIELSLRNRFFLDQLQSFISATKKPIFINIGAGFTSYPFLVDTSCTCIEADLPHVIDFKQRNIRSFIKDRILPERDITFIGVDLSKETDRARLQHELVSLVKNHPSFILLEGITYYLDKSVLIHLLNMFCNMQTTGSLLSCDFWDPSVVTHPIFKKFIQYFDDRFGHKKTQYHLFDVDFVTSIKGYHIRKLTDIQQLEKQYLNTTILKDYEKILPENYVVLKKEKTEWCKN